MSCHLQANCSRHSTSYNFKTAGFHQTCDIDIAPVEDYIPQRLGQAVSVQQYVPDARDYPQHVLDDRDPLRQIKRQEYVKPHSEL